MYPKIKRLKSPLLWSAFDAATVVGGAVDGVEFSEIKAYGVGADGM